MFRDLFIKKKQPSRQEESKIMLDQRAAKIEDKIYNGYVKEASDTLIIVRCDNGFDYYITDKRGWHFLTKDNRPELATEEYKDFCLYKRVQRVGKTNVMETYKEE